MSTGIIRDVCANCRFWRRYGGHEGDERPRLRDGDCRRYPPVQQGQPTEYTVRMSETSEFPATAEDGWCGEFVRKSLLEIAEDKP